MFSCSLHPCPIRRPNSIEPLMRVPFESVPQISGSAAIHLSGLAGLIMLLLSLPLENAAAQDLSAEEIRPFTLTGTLITAGEHYDIPGLDTRRPRNSARLYFNPTLSIYGLQLPFSFLLSTQERSYNQPFNQFGVSPTYRWLTLHAGYRSLRFSEFTLNDAVILGGGAEVNQELFRVRGIYGRIRRAVEEDTTDAILAVYKRVGWAAGGGIGTKETYVNLNLLHAWDDATSLTRPLRITELRPAENVTAGLDGRLPIDGGRVVLDAEIAGSVFSRDAEQSVIENAEVPSAILMETRYSSRFNLAMRAGATYNAELWALRLEYARVEPEYETMGAVYTQNDYEDITAKPSFRLPDGSFRVAGSLGWRHDNLFDDRQFTIDRIIGSANVNWMPGPAFNIDGNYSNYSMASGAGSLPVNDSTRLDNVSESWSLSPRLALTGTNTQHFLMLLLTRQIFTDENLLTGASSDNDVLTALLSYTLGFASGYGFSGSFLFTEVHTAFITNIVRGLTVEVNRSFFSNALNSSLSYAINLTRASSESATDTQHLVTLALRYRLSRLDAMDFRYQFNSYHAVDPSRRSYEGNVLRLQYTRSFAFGTD
jgi:hypothetical protein